MAVENESGAPAHTIKIEADKRYILVIDFPEDIPTEGIRNISNNVKKHLDHWQHSDDQFLVIGLMNGIKLRVERIPDDND